MPWSRKKRAASRTECLVERPEFFAEEIITAAGLAHVAQRDKALGLHPEIRIAIALRHRLTRDFENMAEAFGDDQAEAGDLTLQQGIGGNGSAVRQTGERRPAMRRAMMAFTPRTRPIAGFDGVLATLVTRMVPAAASTQTISVNVPPVSMPIRR